MTIAKQASQRTHFPREGNARICIEECCWRLGLHREQDSSVHDMVCQEGPRLMAWHPPRRESLK